MTEKLFLMALFFEDGSIPLGNCRNAIIFESLLISSQLSIYQRMLLFPRPFGNSPSVSNFTLNYVSLRAQILFPFSP